MRGRVLFVLAVTTLLLLAPRAYAANFFFTSKNPVDGTNNVNAAGALVLSGPIVPGDYDRMLARMAAEPDRYLAENSIILASDGGDVREALRIAKLAKSLFATVYVGPFYGPCVSACFFIYSAANVRLAAGDRILGIHRPYVPDAQFATLSPADAEKVQTAILASARRYLQENNVPAYLIEEMFRRASNDVYWLSPRDVTYLGERSRWFDQYLVAKCSWNDRVEQAALRGDSEYEAPFKGMMACLDRVTRPAARRALFRAFRQEAARKGDSPDLTSIRAAVTTEGVLTKLPRCHEKGTVDPTTDECPDFK